MCWERNFRKKLIQPQESITTRHAGFAKTLVAVLA